MSSGQDNRYRRLLALFLLVLIAGAVWAAYKGLTRQFVWRVAVDQGRMADYAVLDGLGRWMVQANRRSRLELVHIPDDARALEALRTGEVDMATVRADQPVSGSIASLATLYREVVVFVALPRSGIDGWTKLKGKTLALVGHITADDQLIRKILRLRNITDVKLVEAPRKDPEPFLSQSGAQVVVQVSPLVDTQQSDQKLGSTIRRLKPGATLLEIADAEAIAASDKRYESIDVPVGGLRVAPPLPQEETSTLAVARHLVVRGAERGYVVQRVLIDIMDAKRAISPDVPLARKIGSPGVEKDGVIKVHPGATRYFNGEELALSDLVLEWIYILPMILGGLGALGSWLADRFWRPDRRTLQSVMADVMTLRSRAATLRSGADLKLAETDFSQLSAEVTRMIADSKLPFDEAGPALLALDLAERTLDKARLRLAATA